MVSDAYLELGLRLSRSDRGHVITEYLLVRSLGKKLPPEIVCLCANTLYVLFIYKGSVKLMHPDQPSSAETRFLELKGGVVAYTDEGSGPILLCIHGIPGSKADFSGS